MRVRTRICLAVVALAVPLATVALAAGPEMPKRKPGHWRITTVAASLGKTTIDTCVGPDDNIAVPEDSGDCGKPEVTSAGSETIVTVVCQKPHGKQTMSTAFNGDFNKRYHGIMRMTFDPPEGYPSLGVTLDGEYIGPDCPPETKK